MAESSYKCAHKNSDPAGTNCQEHADRIANPNPKARTMTTVTATPPAPQLCHLSDWTRQRLASLRARRADLSGLSPDELRANQREAMRGKGSYGMAEPDGLGLVAEAEQDHDGAWHYSDAIVTDPAEFAARFGGPVTHERALRLLVNGALTSDESRAMVAGFEAHAERHAGDF